MRLVTSLLTGLLLVLQDPVPTVRIPHSPPPSVTWAQASMRGLRLADLRPEGLYVIGSACPVGAFSAYTAAHVVDDIKGELIALPNYGYRSEPKDVLHVHVVYADKKKDIAKIVPDSADDLFPYVYRRGPVPLAGAEVRGVFVLPPPILISVPAVGTFYGEGDGHLWSSQSTGPGSSGSCLLDDQDRAFAMVQAVVSWGEDSVSPSLLPKASLSIRIPD